MKLDKDQKNRIYTAIETELEDALKVSLPKGKKKEQIEVFIRFATVFDNPDYDRSIRVFEDYVGWCATSFQNWTEASNHNWLGYLRNPDRIKLFLHRLKTRAPEIAGKKGEDTWSF